MTERQEREELLRKVPALDGAGDADAVHCDECTNMELLRRLNILYQHADGSAWFLAIHDVWPRLYDEMDRYIDYLMNPDDAW